jgi:hypothetical protein
VPPKVYLAVPKFPPGPQLVPLYSSVAVELPGAPGPVFPPNAKPAV